MRRSAAVGAVTAALAGAAGLLVATAGDGYSGYVSESGVPGALNAGLYRTSVQLVALALGLLALAIRDHRSSPQRWAVLALAVAAPFASLSGVATCSPGCPLPPYEESTAGDLVHAGAAIVALGLSAVAMLVLAGFAADPVVRLVSRIGVIVAVPLLAAAAVAIVGLGRGPTSGILERLALVAAVGWLFGVAVAGARPQPPAAGPPAAGPPAAGPPAAGPPAAGPPVDRPPAVVRAFSR